MITAIMIIGNVREDNSNLMTGMAVEGMAAMTGLGNVRDESNTSDDRCDCGDGNANSVSESSHTRNNLSGAMTEVTCIGYIRDDNGKSDDMNDCCDRGDGRQ
jgi:hypothetical protein